MKLFHMQKKTETAQIKLKLIKECSLTFPSPWKLGRAKKYGYKKTYNPYIEDFVIDRKILSDLMDSLVALDAIDLVKNTEQDWTDDCSEREVELEPEMDQMHEQELTN